MKRIKNPIQDLDYLRNLVNWRDVITDAKNKPAPCKRFVNLVLDSDIIAAALEFFGMKTTDNEPTKHIINDMLKTSIKAVRQRYFYRVITEFIATYIVNWKLYENHFINIEAFQNWETAQPNQPVLVDHAQEPM